MSYNMFGYPMYPNIQSGTNDIQGVRWVASIEEVRAASVPYGKSLFMDNNQDVFYVKDSNGSVKSFSFKEIPQPTPENFVTRQEFDDLRSKYEQLVQSTQQPITGQQIVQPDANSSNDESVQWQPGASQAGAMQSDSIDGVVTVSAGTVPQPSGNNG